MEVNGSRVQADRNWTFTPEDTALAFRSETDRRVPGKRSRIFIPIDFSECSLYIEYLVYDLRAVVTVVRQSSAPRVW